MPPILLDTGPLVAFLNRRDRYHAWAKERLAELQPPLQTCEAVLSETLFLLRRARQTPDAVLELVQRDLIRVTFGLNGELAPIRYLMNRYASLPMSFADACLVRLAELQPSALVLTLDNDFRIYRRHRREKITAIMPSETNQSSVAKLEV